MVPVEDAARVGNVRWQASGREKFLQRDGRFTRLGSVQVCDLADLSDEFVERAVVLTRPPELVLSDLPFGRTSYSHSVVR